VQQGEQAGHEQREPEPVERRAQRGQVIQNRDGAEEGVCQPQARGDGEGRQQPADDERANDRQPPFRH
jgi:hypothetical protein